jgi:hypothetical protein
MKLSSWLGYCETAREKTSSKVIGDDSVARSECFKSWMMSTGATDVTATGVIDEDRKG